MYGFVPEEMVWASVQEHELEARRLARQATPRRPAGRWLRSLLARKLVQTGLKIDQPAGVAAIKSALKAGY